MKRTPIIRRTPLKRVSVKRAKEAPIYAERRKLFLTDRPVCQIWLAENGWKQIVFDGDWAAYQRPSSTTPAALDVCGLSHMFGTLFAPRSTEIHHRAKRGKNYLNEATWMAVSREMHEKVEQNKSWARQRGYLV